MSTVLISGGAGYVGGQCTLGLLENGYDVVVFDNLCTGSQKTIDTLKSNEFKGKLIDFIIGSLQNMSDIENVFAEHRIDAVIHFAAFSQVTESMKKPAEYYRNNTAGTMNLLDAMRNHGVDKIVFSSTAAVYGEPIYVPIDEKHPCSPINPYGKSKLLTENIMDSYDETYGIRSVRMRYFNVVGADGKIRIGESHDPETHLVPNVLKCAIQEKEFCMFGTDYDTRDGTCVRDYVNVEDLADAHISALDYLKNGGKTDCFNLGTGTGNTVKEIVEECERAAGKKIKVRICPRRDGDPASLVADYGKAKRILGWTPKRSLSQSISTAYQWELKKSQ